MFDVRSVVLTGALIAVGTITVMAAVAYFTPPKFDPKVTDDTLADLIRRSGRIA